MTGAATRIRPGSWLIFGAVVGALFLWFDYPDTLTKRPQSVHQWRQCDGASIALTYAHNGLRFFQPAAHNQHSADGRTVSEFPVVYYLDGALIRLFGHPDFFTRLTTLLLFWLGLLFLFRLGLLLTGSVPWSLVPVVLMHAFPVAAYYAATSLPDIPAVSFAFGGLLFTALYLKSEKKRQAFTAAALFALAGLLKPTALAVLPAVGVLIAGLWVARKDRRPIRLPDVVLLALPVLLTAAWILWARHYNAVNDSHTFLQGIKPLWHMDKDFIDLTSLRIKQDWLPQYAWKPALVLAVILGLVFLAWPGRRLWPAKAALLTLAATSLAYFYTFFEQFYHHDYYAIELYPLVIAGTLGGTYVLSRIPGPAQFAALTVTGILLLLNLNYTRHHLAARYGPVHEQYHSYNDDYFDLEPRLREAGITRNDHVIASADQSPNISLYLMDQPGFTRFPFGLPPERIAQYIDQGARYLIHDTGHPEHLQAFTPYLKELLIEHKSLQVYQLQGN